MTEPEIMEMRQRLLQLPRLRQEDWYTYLDNFFNFLPANNVGEILNIAYPELIRALAVFSMQGMSLERIAGLLQGISLMQTLHHAGMLKVEHAPMIEKPMVE